MRAEADSIRAKPSRALSGLLCLSLALAPLFPSHSVWAGQGVLEYDDICKDIAASTNPTKKEYCDAAKASEKAAQANFWLGKVWIGVSAVCTASCAATLTGAMSGTILHNEWLCAGSNAAGAVTEGIVNKQLAQAIMNLAGSAGSIMVAKMMADDAAKEAAKDGAKEVGKEGAKKSKNYGACLLAATSLAQVIARAQGESADKKAAQQALAMAAQQHDSNATGTDGRYQPPTLPGRSGGSGANMYAGAGGKHSITGSGEGGADAASGDPCKTAQATGSAGPVVSCALAKDSKLPSFVSSPRFGDDFEKVAGRNLDDFFKESGTTGSPGALSAMSNLLSSSGMNQLAAAMNEAERGMGSFGVSGSSYAGGGGGGGGGGDSEMADMAGLMQGMMSQFMPGAGGAKAGPTSHELRYGSQGRRAPSGIYEDTTLNIFERVSHRYSVVTPQILEGDRP